MSSHVVFLIGTGLAAVAVTAVGCAAADAAPAVDQVYKPSAMTLPPPEEDGGNAVAAAASGAAAPHAFGSPLCNASYSTCYPDEDLPGFINNPDTPFAKLCVRAPDGGVSNASPNYNNGLLACHVELNFAGEVAPTCTVAGTLTDSSHTACSAATDCAAGYECIAGGSCRHYCCAGECFDPTEFCDIQQTTGNPSIKVPVCMPIRSCGLLDQPSDAGACPLGQTCSVVRVEDGATSCVAVGNSNVGDECDTDQCASGLVCLGTAGDRHCYKLCHTAPGSTDCPASKQTCKGGLPLFPLPGIGICQ